MNRKKKRPATKASSGPLKGWAAIADFLKMPAATVQRWAKAGMPVTREGRFTVADPQELRVWLGREAQMPGPAHIATKYRRSCSRVEGIHYSGQEAKPAAVDSGNQGLVSNPV